METAFNTFDITVVETWFFIMWSIVFSATIWCIFMVAKDANYKIGYKDTFVAEEFSNICESLNLPTLREIYAIEHNIEYTIDRIGESSEPSFPA